MKHLRRHFALDGLMEWWNVLMINHIWNIFLYAEKIVSGLKNKSLAISLEKRGLMTDFGYAKIKEAKENGQWDNVSKLSAITDKQIEELIKLLKENRCAYENFQHMSLSVKKHILKLI